MDWYRVSRLKRSTFRNLERVTFRRLFSLALLFLIFFLLWRRLFPERRPLLRLDAASRRLSLARLNAFSRRDVSGAYVIVDDLTTALPSIFKNDDDDANNLRKSNVPYLLTLATQTSVSNLRRALTLSRRWTGAVSVAVFAADANDVASSVGVVRILTQCGVGIERRFKFHLVFAGSEFPDEEWEVPEIPEETNCDGADAFLKRVFWKRKNYAENAPSQSPSNPYPIPYPVNLLRNVALSNVASPFVCVIDVDLLPSLDLERRFEELIAPGERARSARVGAALEWRRYPPSPENLVYVLPAYEMDEGEEVPETKRALMSMRKERRVRPFYDRVCRKCHRQTDYETWETIPSSAQLSVAYHRDWIDPWEPFYIGETKRIPKYDERFKQYGFNRIQQVCEVHVAGFRFAVLDEAFLLHLGFKEADEFHTEKQKDNERNRILFRRFKEELKRRYSRPHVC